jgi:hypothetical protein
LDLSSLASVKKFTDEIKSKYTKLDIVVLNAGLNTGGLTTDGLDARWQVNYLGHWLLISELFPLCAKGKGPNNDGGRVVLLSSVCHHFGLPSLFEYHCKGVSNNLATRLQQNASVYSDSKLAMNFLAYELQKKFDSYEDEDDDDKSAAPVLTTGRYDDDKTAHEKATLLSTSGDANSHSDSSYAYSGSSRGRSVAVNPGAVASDIWRGVPWLIRTLIFDPLMTLTFLNTDEGAATSIHAALHPLPSHECNRRIPPYFSPYWYWVPSVFGYAFSLPFETIGPFLGSRPCPQTLPDNMDEVSQQLWKVSEEAVQRLLLEKEKEAK